MHIHNNMINVCVVLLNWNGHDDTRRCVESLKRSQYPIHIIVVDNASTERDIETLVSAYPDIFFIQCHENGGFSSGNNRGIKAALELEADYIFVLNNDTVIEDDTIQKLLNFMESHSGVVAATPLILYGDERERIWYGGGDFIWSLGGARSTRFNQLYDDAELVTPEQAGFISGCAMFIRAEAIRQTQGFDEAFFMYVEDIDLSLRLLDIGSMFLVPDAKVYHYAHASARKGAEKHFRNPSSANNKNLLFYLRHVLWGYLYLVSKHKPPIMLRIRFYLYFYLKWFRQALIYALKGRWDAALLVFDMLLIRRVDESSAGP